MRKHLRFVPSGYRQRSAETMLGFVDRTALVLPTHIFIMRFDFPLFTQEEADDNLAQGPVGLQCGRACASPLTCHANDRCILEFDHIIQHTMGRRDLVDRMLQSWGPCGCALCVPNGSPEAACKMLYASELAHSSFPICCLCRYCLERWNEMCRAHHVRRQADIGTTLKLRTLASLPSSSRWSTRSDDDEGSRYRWQVLCQSALQEVNDWFLTPSKVPIVCSP